MDLDSDGILITAGRVVVFATAKILELLAIPLLVVVSIVWFPLGMVLLPLMIAVHMCDAPKGVIITAQCAAIWPVLCFVYIFRCIFGA
jgi:hypothetical protein